MYHTWMRYFTPTPLHHRLGLVCLGVGLQHGTLPPVGPRTLDHHVALVISAGRGWYAGPDGRIQEITAPALLWLLPGVVHHYGADPDSGWDESFVDFTGPATATYRELGYIDADRRPVPLTDTVAARAAVGRIARAARRDNPLLEVETSAAVHELLVALRRARAGSDADGDPVLRALARDAFAPLTVAGHAARNGMTPAALRAAVRDAAGCTPKDYLLGIRLGRAKELLAATELPVAAVARRVGYDDPAYFSRLFARRVGVSPVRFRERQGRSVPGGWSETVPDPDDPPVLRSGGDLLQRPVAGLLGEEGGGRRTGGGDRGGRSEHRGQPGEARPPPRTGRPRGTGTTRPHGHGSSPSAKLSTPRAAERGCTAA